MLIDRLIANILADNNLGNHINNIIQVLIVLIWIYITRKSKAGYKRSISISLLLLVLSILMLLFTLTPTAAFIAEYSFIFLSIGILQIIFTKQDKTDE